MDGEQLAGRVEQVDVALQQVGAGQLVDRVGPHAEVLDRRAGQLADPQGPPDRDPHVGAVGSASYGEVVSAGGG